MHTRTASLVLLVTCGLSAQSLPIGMGFGTTVGVPGLTNYLDWYTASASGCTAGANGKCVGNLPTGDTMYCAWLPSALGLPITGGKPVACTLNDYTWTTSSIVGNIGMFQFDTFDWSTPLASRMTLVNAMTAYGTNGADTNVPAGWFGHSTSGDDGGFSATWKSRNQISIGSNLYWPILRVPSAGTPLVHDATILVSPDSGLHWCNPYTYYQHSGSPGCDADNWSATGDAPLCGAANGSPGSNCTDTGYLDSSHSSMMWKGLPGTTYICGPIEYGQAGTTMPTPPDGSDPATYLYCLASGFLDGSTNNYPEGTIWRVPVASILDISAWRYYTCPTITESYRCPLSASASWTATFADRTTVLPTWVWGIKYLPEFKSYLGTGSQGMFYAPSLAGPWTMAQSNFETFGISQTFMNPVPGLGYNVISSNPPHVKVTMLSATLEHSAERSPVMSEWDFTLGHNVQGAQPILRKWFNPFAFNGYYAWFSGLQVSDGHTARSIPQNGLIAAWDMYDYGGTTATAGPGGFRDMANGNAFLIPSASGGAGWVAGQGLQLAATGPTFNGASGYPLFMKSITYSWPTTVGGGAYLDRPISEMAGNASWTVAVVFQRNTPTDAALDTVPIWQVGDPSDAAGNKGISLSYPKGTGTLELGWGTANFVNHYRYATSFTPTSGNWYLMVATVTASGSTPVTHLWTGDGGLLVDKLAGISRTASGGSPSATPNTSSTTMFLGLDPTQSVSSINGAYAGLYIYSRAISQAEAGLMYTTLKANLLGRGITLQ